MMDFRAALEQRWDTLFPASSLRGRFVRNISWSLIGTVGGQAVSFLLAVLLGRLLGKEGYGELTTIIGTVGMFSVFAGIGLGMTATKYIAEFRKSDPLRAGRIVGMSAVVVTLSSGALAVAMAVFAPYIADKALNAPRLAAEVRVSSLLLFFMTCYTAQAGVFSGLESFRTIAWLMVLDAILKLVFSLAGFHLAGLSGVVTFQAISSGISWLASLIVLRVELGREGIPISYRGIWRELSVLYRFSMPLVLSSIVVTPVQSLAMFFLVHQPGGYGEMGLYSACKRVDNILLFLPTIFMRVAMPMMSSFFGEASSDGHANYGKVLQGYFSLTVAMIFPVGVALMFSSNLIMRIFGHDFSAGATILVGVVLNDLIASVGAVGGTALQSQGRMWLGFAINVCYAAIYIVLIWVGVPRFGANALAFGSAISYLITSVWVYWVLWADLPNSAARGIVLSLVLAAVLAAVCVPLSPMLRLGVGVPVLLVTAYVVVFHIIGPEVRASVFHYLRAGAAGPGDNAA